MSVISSVVCHLLSVTYSSPKNFWTRFWFKKYTKTRVKGHVEYLIPRVASGAKRLVQSLIASVILVNIMLEERIKAWKKETNTRQRGSSLGRGKSEAKILHKLNISFDKEKMIELED